jgi:hypothetical protein
VGSERLELLAVAREEGATLEQFMIALTTAGLRNADSPGLSCNSSLARYAGDVWREHLTVQQQIKKYSKH